MKTLLATLCLALASPLPGLAAPQMLTFPGPATPIGERMALMADLEVPIGPWRDGEIKSIVTEGQLSQTAWRLDDTAMATIDLMFDLRGQLEAQGFDVLYECRTRSCGGFDFRFGIDVMPEPQMHVDLGDYRFLSARRGTDDAADFVTLMVSQSSGTGFVQVTHVAQPGMMAPVPVLSTRSADGVVGTAATAASVDVSFDPALTQRERVAAGSLPVALSAALQKDGSIPLDDLTFETGSTRLGPGPFPSLEVLAAYLKANPDRTVTLVGHSDSSGGLAENIALSKQRAAAVVAALSRDYGVPKARLEAEGVGYLAPRASNSTDDGRNMNRRVEVVLTALD